MTETQGPPTADQQQTGAGRPGVDRANLRSYETLHRSVTDRKVAGVAGGLGRHLNIDPTILRVLLVVLCLFGGAGFVVYGVAWLIVPEDGREAGILSMSPGTRNAFLVGAGVVAAFVVVGHAWNGVGAPWPLVLVGLALLLYFAFRDRGHGGQAQPPAPYGPGSTYGPGPSYSPGPTYGPAPLNGPARTGPYGPAPTAEDTRPLPDPAIGYPQQPPPWIPPTGSAPASPRRRKSGPLLFGPTLALVAVALGALGLYDASGGHVVDSAYPALALTVIGAMLVLGAFVGRAGGLILLGIVSAVALAATAVVGSVGDLGQKDAQRLSATPHSVATVKDRYFVPHGRVFLDLSEVTDPAALAGRRIDVGTRVGEVVVVLPRGVVSQVDANVSGPGQIDLPGHSSGGLDNTISESLGSGPGTLFVHTHMFAGHIEVRNP